MGVLLVAIAAKQERNHGEVSETAQALPVLKKRTSLIAIEPASGPRAQLLHTFDSPNTGCKFRAQHPRICCFISETPDRSHSLIDCSRCQPERLQIKTKSKHHISIQGQSLLGTVPDYELLHRELVAALECGELKLLSTEVFAWSRSVRRRTIFRPNRPLFPFAHTSDLHAAGMQKTLCETDSDTSVACSLDLGSYSPTASEPTNTAGGKSCAILRRLVVVGSANRLLRRASVLARGDPRVAPESMSEMGLVCIPHGQRRINHTGARAQ